MATYPRRGIAQNVALHVGGQGWAHCHSHRHDNGTTMAVSNRYGELVEQIGASCFG